MFNRLLVLTLLGLSPLLSYGQLNKPPTIEEEKAKPPQYEPAERRQPTQGRISIPEGGKEEELIKPSEKPANGFGIGIGVGTNTCAGGELLYKYKKSLFSLGGWYQFNGQQGLWRPDIKQPSISIQKGAEPFFATFFVGYDYCVLDRLSLGFQWSYGTSNYYTNHEDSNTLNGGYHTIDYNNIVYGLGLKARYSFSAPVTLSLGYDHIAGGTFSIALTPFSRRIN